MSVERWTKALQSGAETPEGLRRRLAQTKLALEDARYFKQDDAELAREVEDLETVLASADTTFAGGSYGKDFREAKSAPAARTSPKPDATRARLVELDRRVTDAEYDLQDARRLRRTEDEILKIRRDLSNLKAERDDLRRGLEPKGGLKANRRAPKKNPSDTRGRNVWRTYEADPTPLNLLAVEQERVRKYELPKYKSRKKAFRQAFELFRGLDRLAGPIFPAPSGPEWSWDHFSMARPGDHVVMTQVMQGLNNDGPANWPTKWGPGVRVVHVVISRPAFVRLVQDGIDELGRVGQPNVELGTITDRESLSYEVAWGGVNGALEEAYENGEVGPDGDTHFTETDEPFWPSVLHDAAEAGIQPPLGPNYWPALFQAMSGQFWGDKPLLTWDPKTMDAWAPGPDETSWSRTKINPKLSVSKGKLKLGKTPIKEVPELHENLAVIGPLGEPAAFMGFDPSTRIMLFLTDDRSRPEVARKARDKGEFPIFPLRRMIGGSGTIEMFWRHPDAKPVAAAAQYYFDGDQVVVTHLAVRPRFQRMGLGERMLKWIQANHPGKKVVATDLTKAGRAFSEKHGVEEVK